MRWRARRGLETIQFPDASTLERAAESVLMFELARIGYRGWQYDGPVLMLRSSARLRRDGPDTRGPFGRHLRGDVRWFDIGGTHETVRHQGNEAMTRHLREAVAIAQRELAAMRRGQQTGR
jgi:hypothetical protein